MDSNAHLGQPVLHLLQWMKVVDEMYRLGGADNTAPAAGRGQRITQKILGVFLNRRADWICDALACRNLVELNRELDPVLSTL